MFIAEGDSVRIVNSAVYAMHMLQSEIAGEAGRADLNFDGYYSQLFTPSCDRPAAFGIVSTLRFGPC